MLTIHIPRRYLFALALILATVFGFRLALAWTNPTQAPPNGNVSLPPAQWTASGTAIYNSNSGNVGIGITGPGQKLSVAGTIESTSGGFKFPDGTTQATAGALKSVQTFTTAGTSTWTKPAGITKVLVEVWGGGGGGASSDGGAKPGGGGGGGGYCSEFIDVSAVGSVTITVGAGGAGGVDANGDTGGTSSFGSYCSATGGVGGFKPAAAFGNGGAGGTGSGGNLNFTGQGGAASFGVTGTYAGPGAVGGSAPRGGGGGRGMSYTNHGVAGSQPGGGGSGASGDGALNGGAGGDGMAVVWEY